MPQNLLIAASDDGWVRIWNVTVGEARSIHEAAAEAHVNLGFLGCNRRCSSRGVPTTVALSAWLWINPWPQVAMTEACLFESQQHRSRRQHKTQKPLLRKQSSCMTQTKE